MIVVILLFVCFLYLLYIVAHKQITMIKGERKMILSREEKEPKKITRRKK